MAKSIQPTAFSANLSNDILCIVGAALRGAAMAPSDRNALDLVGEALRAIADLSRKEVRHGI